MEPRSHTRADTSTLPSNTPVQWDMGRVPQPRRNLLPATYRTGEDNIVAGEPTSELLHHELVPNRLEEMRQWLKYAGRPMPPRPLHYQLVLGREIVISENIELHMVWAYGNPSRIFLKPLPNYLLDNKFWSTYILPDAKTNIIGQPQLAAAARGLLFSYTALIAYESDFKLAKDRGLLPAESTWDTWQAMCAKYLEHHTYASVSLRYWYGELRLARLDKIASLTSGSFLGGYSRVASPNNYWDWIRQNSAVLTTLLGYVVIALTAMQVGLATGRLGTNTPFQDVSYGLTVFALIGPLGAGAMGLVYLLVMVFANWAATNSYHEKRLREMGVELDDRKKF